MIRINLLPVRAARKKENVRRQVSVAAMMVVLTVIILTYFHVTVNGKITDMQDKITKTQQEINSLQVKLDQVKNFKEKKKALQSKLDVIESLKQSARGPVKLLMAVGNLIPDKAWLNRITEKGTTVDMDGVALDNETISNFLMKLEADPSCAAVVLKESHEIDKKGRKFQAFSLKFEDKSGEKKKEAAASEEVKNPN